MRRVSTPVSITHEESPLIPGGLRFYVKGLPLDDHIDINVGLAANVETVITFVSQWVEYLIAEGKVEDKRKEGEDAQIQKEASRG